MLQHCNGTCCVNKMYIYIYIKKKKMYTNSTQRNSLQKLPLTLRCIQTANKAGLSKSYLKLYDVYKQHPTKVSQIATITFTKYTNSTQRMSLQKLHLKFRCTQTSPNAGLYKSYLKHYDLYVTVNVRRLVNPRIYRSELVKSEKCFQTLPFRAFTKLFW